MAILPSAHTNNFVIPKGKVYVKKSNEDSWRYIGANQVATLTREVEDLELMSAESGKGFVLDKQEMNIKYSLALTLADISLDNLLFYVSGNLYEITQASGSVTDEEKVIELDRMYQLGDAIATPTGARKVSSLTIKNKNGDDALAWASTTAYGLNEYAVPTVDNGHFYKVTVAGTSDSVEPTWPTDGSTVVDGTVTFEDAGLISLSSTDDYEINEDLGTVFIKKAAVNVVENDTYVFAYTKADTTWEQVLSSSTQAYYEVRTIGDNPVGANRDYLFPRCTLSASGDLTLKSEESAYQQFDIGVSILLPEDGRNQVYIDSRPI